MTLAISSWTESSIEVALERYESDIIAVDAYLKDLHGPSGARDKTALIRVLMKGMPPVIVDSSSEDLYLAVDRSARRARTAVERAIARQRKLLRARPRNPEKSVQAIQAA
ncbi:MAG: HPF/RaiA family ribosome-associated protein [Pseudomonadota bacterium]